MFSFLHFFQTDPVIGLMVAFAIFLITVFLVAKRSIQFSTALSFLIFAVLIGMIITNQKMIHHYFDPRVEWKSSEPLESPSDSLPHLASSIQNLEKEILLQKNGLNQANNQIKEAFNLINLQKQELQTFIQQTKDEFSAIQVREKEKGEDILSPPTSVQKMD